MNSDTKGKEERARIIRKDPKAGGHSTRYFIVLDEPKAPQLIRNLSWN